MRGWVGRPLLCQHRAFANYCSTYILYQGTVLKDLDVSLEKKDNISAVNTPLREEVELCKIQEAGVFSGLEEENACWLFI